MTGKLHSFWRSYRRRRRSWRYISPGRRGTGLLVLALILAAVYAYWHFTRGDHIRSMAEEYLSEMTGSHVHIRSARFRLFGPVELEGVSLRLPGEAAPSPLFEARRVVLEHRPWSLVSQARFAPTRVICSDAAVRVRFEGPGGPSNIDRLRRLSRQQRGERREGPPGALPAIEMRNVEVTIAGRMPRTEPQRMMLDMSLLARDEDEMYELVVEDAEQEARVRLLIDVTAGEPVEARATMPLAELRDLVPELAEVMDQYLSGLEGQCEVSWYRDRQRVAFRFHDARLRLAEDLGGLWALDVYGAMESEETPEGRKVHVAGLHGRLVRPAAGGPSPATAPAEEATVAEFSLHADYEEQDAGPTVSAAVELSEVDVALLPEISRVGQQVRTLREQLDPTGRAEALIEIDTARGEPLEVAGTVTLRDVAVRPGKLPYPLTDIGGRLTFDKAELELDLAGAAGDGRVACEGTVDLQDPGSAYDLSVSATDIALDDTLATAMQAGGLAQTWADLSPAGFGTFVARVRRADAASEPEVELSILPSERGPLRIMHRFFPYPVTVVAGTVEFRDGNVHIPPPYESRPGYGPILAVAGDATSSFYGNFKNPTGDDFKLAVVVEADNMPIDETLEAALGPAAREALRSLHATGRTRNVSARITQQAGEEVQFDIALDLEGVDFRADAFPYSVSNAEGRLQIFPERVVVQSIQGEHPNPEGEPTDVEFSGEVLFTKPAGVRLEGRMENVLLGPAVRDALAENVREVWDSFAPAGRADVTVEQYVEGTPEAPEPVFDIRVSPRDVTFRYEDVPYRFQVGGTERSGGLVRFRPGRVELTDLSSTRKIDGAGLDSLAGTVTYGPDAIVADLRIRAGDLELSPERLEALPPAIADPAMPLKPRGAFDLDFHPLHIRWRRPEGPATRPATRPAGDDADPEFTVSDWHVEGDVRMNGVTLETSAGEADLDGEITGRVARDGEGLAIAAKLSGVTLAAEDEQRVTDLTAEIEKAGGSERIFVNEMFGRTFGGGVEGQGVILLDDPASYRLRATFDEIDLAKLLASTGAEAGVAGRLQGRIELSAEVGSKTERRASGQLRIFDARVSKLPVLLGALQVIYLSVPGRSPVTDGLVEYQLEGKELVFREIHLGGPTISIVGSGTMDMDTNELQLVFLRTESAVLPRIEGINELLEGLGGELVEVRVGGTLSDPKVDTELAPRVAEAVRVILNPQGSRE